jgi:hypothetical protein
LGEKSGAPFVIELTELFSEKNAAINREIIDPVLFLLANHDLYAIFELPESGQKQAFAFGATS